MGTKRIGLARVEKLLENLKREIDWGTATTMKVGDNAAVGMTPEIICKWNWNKLHLSEWNTTSKFFCITICGRAIF